MGELYELMRLDKLQSRFISELFMYEIQHRFSVLNAAATWQFGSYHFDEDFLQRTGAMPRGKKPQVSAAARTVSATKPDVRWLNYRLTPPDIAVVLEDSAAPEDCCVRLGQLFASGADFSVRFVPDRGNYSAFGIIDTGREDSHDRVGISAFGGNVWQAIAGLLFKYSLLQHNPSAFADSGGGMGIG